MLKQCNYITIHNPKGEYPISKVKKTNNRSSGKIRNDPSEISAHLLNEKKKHFNKFAKSTILKILEKL